MDTLFLASFHGMQVRRVKWAVVHPAVDSNPMGIGLVSIATQACCKPRTWEVRCAAATPTSVSNPSSR